MHSTSILVVDCLRYLWLEEVVSLQDFFVHEAHINKLLNVWFFESPWVIVPHHTLHAPLVDAAGMAAGFLLWRTSRRRGASTFWFFTGCLIHALIDIPVHRQGGPLLLFPFNWAWSFHSPVSHWHADHYGTYMIVLEQIITLTWIVYLVRRRWWQQMQGGRRSTKAVAMLMLPAFSLVSVLVINAFWRPFLDHLYA